MVRIYSLSKGKILSLLRIYWYQKVPIFDREWAFAGQS
jgi:hypothetical protein